MSKIVSVQDISCYGQCSLTVALPVLSAYGIETAILPSGILSNHTGTPFSAFTFFDLTEEMVNIVDRWNKENITYDAIYTGYIGDARQFDTIKAMRSLLNEGGKMIVDPAMADHGKLYVALNDEIVAGMRGLVKEADIKAWRDYNGLHFIQCACRFTENYTKDKIISSIKEINETKTSFLNDINEYNVNLPY